MSWPQTSFPFDPDSCYNGPPIDWSAQGPPASGIATDGTSFGNPPHPDDFATDLPASDDRNDHESFYGQMLHDYQELQKTVRDLEAKLAALTAHPLNKKDSKLRAQYVSLQEDSAKKDRTITTLKQTIEGCRVQIRGLISQIERLTQRVQTLQSGVPASNSSQPTTQFNSFQNVQWASQTGQLLEENQGTDSYLLAPQMEEGGNNQGDDDYRRRWYN
ncbi:uncharacterized protein L203_104789 [Cryptococcus depauperatus CBS 7841]|uniref:Uncharacterized protein n=1 Tax=Cryptococcus depauperatus CBS 7841 TaxID=1295531 RepID=A0A1E3INA5_9TREE|nr:hypothetical protein L203_02004 [Cryptococcus depauperatus CBS 7841]